MKRISVIVTAAFCIIILASSCVNNNDNTSPSQGYFLVANISPNSPALSININGSGFVTNFPYGAYTPYYSTPAGAYTFDIYGSGSSPVLTNTVNMEASKIYTYFLIDSFNKLKPAFVQDDLTAPSTDSVYIRFFNFSPNSAPLNLVDSAGMINLYSTRLFNDQATNLSYQTFNRLKAGIYTLKLTDIGGSTVLARRVDTLAGGHVYTIFAKGNMGGTSPQDIGIGQIQNY